MVCGQGGVRHGKHSSVSTLLLITLSKTKCEESATTMSFWGGHLKHFGQENKVRVQNIL